MSAGTTTTTEMNVPAAAGVPTRPELFVLSTARPAEVVDFYRAVTGWELGLTGGLPDARAAGAAEGGQTFLVREGSVGWLPFLTVKDLPAVLERARAAGAERVVHPLPGQVTDRAAIVIDPSSTRLGLWQPSDSAAAPAPQVQEGLVVWIEEKTRDQEAAVAFHTDVFGFAGAGPTGPGKVRFLREPSGSAYAGVMQFDDRWSLDQPPHWLLYVSVADLDATIALALEQRGSLWFEPTDTPLGRLAYVRDPAGNAIAVVELAAGAGAMLTPAAAS